MMGTFMGSRPVRSVLFWIAALLLVVVTALAGWTTWTSFTSWTTWTGEEMSDG